MADVLQQRIFNVPVFKILLLAGAIGIAALIGLQSSLALYVIIAIAGSAFIIFLYHYPLVGVGMVSTLAITGGLTQILKGSILQRLYLIMLLATCLAYAIRLYSDRDLMREWLRIRVSDVLFAAFLLVAYLSLNIAADKNAANKQFGELLRNLVLYFLLTRSIRSFNDLVFVGKFILVGSIWQASTAWGGDAKQVTDSNDVVRISGNLDNVNSFASALLAAVPWAFFFTRYGKRFWIIVGLVGSAILPVTLLGTVSRTAVVVLGVMAIGWPILSARRWKDRLLMLIPVLLVCSYGLMVRWDSIIGRWSALKDLVDPQPVMYVVDEDGGRGELREMGLSIFSENWLLGVGIGNAPMEIGAMRHTYSEFHIHNMFVEVAADMGIFGISAFVAFIAGAFLMGFVAIPRLDNDRDRALIATTMMMLTVLIVFGISGNSHYKTVSYLQLAMAYLSARLGLIEAARRIVQDAPDGWPSAVASAADKERRQWVLKS